MYGSTARGDADASSDLDVLVLADPGLNIPKSAIPRGAHSSRYSWTEWLEMRNEGSIFLQHIAAESRVLSHSGEGLRRFHASIHDLPPYENAHRDVNAFAAALNSIQSELTKDDCCIYFELNTLAMVVRHVSILICYLIGEVNFSRLHSVRIAAQATGAARALADDFASLYEYRLAFQHRAPIPRETPDLDQIYIWLGDAKELLRSAEELIRNADRIRR
ncbi:hypothetical protein BST31_14960 [Mycobacterium marseillense]|nr:nucleotidyltransferase domain-containing protein [Mycobacterium marseillense]ORA91603.1 hypothetical protein BST31_14960 [Mycobacterium marseillense]